MRRRNGKGNAGTSLTLVAHRRQERPQSAPPGAMLTVVTLPYLCEDLLLLVVSRPVLGVAGQRARRRDHRLERR